MSYSHEMRSQGDRLMRQDKSLLNSNSPPKTMKMTMTAGPMAWAASGDGATDPTARPIDELAKLSNVKMPKNLPNLQQRCSFDRDPWSFQHDLLEERQQNFRHEQLFQQQVEGLIQQTIPLPNCLSQKTVLDSIKGAGHGSKDQAALSLQTLASASREE